MPRGLGRRCQHILQPVGTGLTVLVAAWWLVLGGAIIWIMPERVVTAAPTPSAVSVGAIVRIAQPGGSRVPIARDRDSFNAMRLAAAARYEEPSTEGIASFAWIAVEAGQAARVLMVDGDAVQIELLDGSHIGEQAWIRAGALVPN